MKDVQHSDEMCSFEKLCNVSMIQYELVEKDLIVMTRYETED